MHFARRADATPLTLTLMNRGGLQQHGGGRRHSHSQSLWEELLGRKIEASAAKKLEEAFLEYKVRKSVPSWLPFFPNCSFWIPSNEETIKNLQVLAQRIKDSRPTRKERSKAQKSRSHWSDHDKNGAVSTVTAWSIIHHTDKLLSGLGHIETMPADAAHQQSAETGMITETVLENGDKDDDSEEEHEGAAKKKTEGN